MIESEILAAKTNQLLNDLRTVTRFAGGFFATSIARGVS